MLLAALTVYVYAGMSGKVNRMAIYRVSVLQSALGQSMMNVLHYESSTVLSGADAVEVADEIRAEYLADFTYSSLSGLWSYVGIELRKVDTPDEPAWSVAPTAGALEGDSPENLLPLQVALLVSGTALTTFPRRVRTYHVGLTEANVVGGMFDTTIVDKFVGFNTRINSIAGVGFTMNRLAVRYGTGEDAGIVVASNPIVAYQGNFVPATQRRRRPGVWQ